MKPELELKAQPKGSKRSKASFSKEWSFRGFFEFGFWAKRRTFIQQLGHGEKSIRRSKSFQTEWPRFLDAPGSDP